MELLDRNPFLVGFVLSSRSIPSLYGWLLAEVRLRWYKQQGNSYVEAKGFHGSNFPNTSLHLQQVGTRDLSSNITVTTKQQTNKLLASYSMFLY
jgi:hypothetical protein